VLCARTNAFVDLIQVCEGAQRQPGGELLGPWIQVTIRQLRPEGSRELISARPRNISRKEHLQGAFTRLTTRTHNSQKPELCT
jgi:hypothetical protein